MECFQISSIKSMNNTQAHLGIEDWKWDLNSLIIQINALPKKLYRLHS